MSADGGGGCDVLVVGAGPTGLALAAQLAASGVSCRVVDRAADRARESRALGVQPRTLEVLRPFGLTGVMLAEGRPATRAQLHAGGRTASVPLFDLGLADTATPFLLLLSQARTEALLLDHLAGAGVRVERRTALEGLAQDGEGVTCSLRGPDGALADARARYVVGCDGARSTVRRLSDIAFPGGRYPQTFLLADLEADGLERGALHAFVRREGPVLFFPLGAPATWRLISMRADAGRVGPAGGEGPGGQGARAVALEELQGLVDRATGGGVRLHDPVWATAFSVHHRHAEAYRAGRALLAGDAAHVHSPVGAQGMNTGVQDALNLGWKLAAVLRAGAPEELLDSYEAERRPVGAGVVRSTDRAFTVATSSGALAQLVRAEVVPRVLPVALRSRRGRAAAFRGVSQLAVTYRGSPAVDAPQRGRRPGPGDRLPDARVVRDDGEGWLQEGLSASAWTLLLCGTPGAWDERAVAALRRRFGDLLQVQHLDRVAAAGVLADPSGAALAALGVRCCASLLVRPDGHVGAREDTVDLTPAAAHLARWLPRPAARVVETPRRGHRPS